MSGQGVIPAAPTGGSAATDAEWLGLDARAVRYDCLKLAAQPHAHDSAAQVVARAATYAAFVLGDAEC